MKKNISPLHFITQDIEGYTHSLLAKEVCSAGCDWVQLRLKNKSDKEKKDQAIETLDICNEYNSILIINDDVELAKAINAHGVHLGRNDMHPQEARTKLGKDYIIGGTADTFYRVKEIYKYVDYIGLGPFRFTLTKEKISPVLGIDGLDDTMQLCKDEGIDIPVVVIGGVEVDDVKSILATGVTGVAVSSAIAKQPDMQKATQDFLYQINNG
jgi:thiamine-phosphate pyrophosphorylase